MDNLVSDSKDGRFQHESENSIFRLLTLMVVEMCFERALSIFIQGWRPQLLGRSFACTEARRTRPSLKSASPISGASLGRRWNCTLWMAGMSCHSKRANRCPCARGGAATRARAGPLQWPTFWPRLGLLTAFLVRAWVHMCAFVRTGSWPYRERRQATVPPG